eukprot:scaffold461643_cov32-Prasinocladus_malaysianus.AAC.1
MNKCIQIGHLESGPQPSGIMTTGFCRHTGFHTGIDITASFAPIYRQLHEAIIAMKEMEVDEGNKLGGFLDAVLNFLPPRHRTLGIQVQEIYGAHARTPQTKSSPYIHGFLELCTE